MTTNSDQSQPSAAAVAPRLSLTTAMEERFRALLSRGEYQMPAFMLQITLDKLDATRADLARARSEAAALHSAASGFIEWMDSARFTFDVPREMWPHTRALYAAVNGFAAPQSEQPAAPVDRSAEHPFVPLSGSQDTGGTYTRCSVIGCTVRADHHPTLGTTPPDHQAAGDEP